MLKSPEIQLSCPGVSTERYETRLRGVLATWVIRSENRHYENGIPSLNRLQMKSGEGKIGSRHYILMH